MRPTTEFKEMIKSEYSISKFYLTALFFLASFSILSPTLSDTIDDEASEISYHLMCPVCQGQSVAESNSELAKDMRAIIRKKLEQGSTKEEILAYFVERYGESILGSPPAKGANWLLWILPAFAILSGGIGIGFFLYRSKTNRLQPEPTKESELISPSSEYIEKLDRELKDLDR
ncbi:MAG: cytochrome c-type biogenesis protein [Thermodesulfobacteriota bacterium]